MDVARDRPKITCTGWTERGTQEEDVSGKVGYPFFQELLHDCTDRTETAMTQEHALKAGIVRDRPDISPQKIK